MLVCSEKVRYFQGMKNTITRLRNSADAAHLLAYSFLSCGAAYVASIGVKLTISISRKNCALGILLIETKLQILKQFLGYYTFGHELAHNFGSQHDPGNSNNNIYTYGHGHLIQGNLPDQ